MTEVNVGMKFGRLTVESKFGYYKKWNCVCECGSETTVVQCHLLSGNTKSCGCLKRDLTIEKNTTHGLSKRPEYSNWKDMNKRCFNPNNKRYADYAKRGISVHPDFVGSFVKWFEEIGEKPKDGRKWSVGRIDNNCWYTYGNIRWELDNTQARNHTKQKNNTTGVTGLGFQSKVISGRTYTSWIARWKSLDGKSKSRNFSADKYGHEEAKQLAIAYRNKMIQELNEQGAGYAESHGSDK